MGGVGRGEGGVLLPAAACPSTHLLLLPSTACCCLPTRWAMVEGAAFSPPTLYPSPQLVSPHPPLPSPPLNLC